MDQLRNELLGALVGLARASESKELLESSGVAMVEGLRMAFGGSCPADDIHVMISKLHEEKKLMAPDCAACQYPCGRTADYDMEEVYGASEGLRDAKLELFGALGEIAVKLSEDAGEIHTFLSEALFQISCTYDVSQLTEILAKAKNIANTK